MGDYRKLTVWERILLWTCGGGLIVAAALTGPLSGRKADKSKAADVNVTVSVEPPLPREKAPPDELPQGRFYKL